MSLSRRGLLLAGGGAALAAASPLAAQVRAGRVSSGSGAPLQPVPTFGRQSLLSWLDINFPAYVFKDTSLTTTIAGIEDASQNGNGFFQFTKATNGGAPQPTIGPLRGAFFGAGCYADCMAPGLINGFQKLTIGIAFTLSSTYSGTAKRTLLSIPNGSGSQDRFRIDATSGVVLTSRKLQVTTRQNDASSHISATTTLAQLSQDTKHTLVFALDMTGTTAISALYVDNALYQSDSWTPTDAAPWVFSLTNPSMVRLGNGYAASAATPTDMPLLGEISRFVAVGDAMGAVQLAALQTYLGS